MTYKPADCVDLSQSYSSELAEPPDYSRSAATLVADYLTALKKQAMKTVERSYGSSALKQVRINWVITTPAVWSLKAKTETLKCAEKAGMGSGRSITLVSEPEAAAVYTIGKMKSHSFNEGNNVVICDAGG